MRFITSVHSINLKWLPLKRVQFKEQHAADTNSPLSQYTCVGFNQYFDNTSLQSNQAENPNELIKPDQNMEYLNT